MQRYEFSTTSKQGFYIGDPCYALSDKRYDEMLEKRGDIYKNPAACVEVDGYKICVGDTKYGDGEYKGLGVDSGQLAIIPLELVEDDCANQDSDCAARRTDHSNSCGYICYNQNPDEPDTAEFIYDDGQFYFDGFGYVDTGYEEDEDEEYYEEEDEEE